MKKCLIIICLLTLFSPVKAQYIILKVIGEVKTKDGVKIVQGARLDQNVPITWTSPKDKIFAIVPGKGGRVITPSTPAKARENLFTELLKSATHTDLITGSFSTMSAVDSIPESLKPDPGNQQPIAFQKINYYLFRPSVFPNLGSNFFYLSVQKQGEAAKSIRLKTKNDTLIITSDDLLPGIDSTNVRYKLYFYNPETTPKSSELSYFAAYFDLQNDMEGIIRYSIEEQTKTVHDKAVVHKYTYSNVYFILGKPNTIMFEYLFDKYWPK